MKVTITKQLAEVIDREVLGIGAGMDDSDQVHLRHMQYLYNNRLVSAECMTEMLDQIGDIVRQPTGTTELFPTPKKNTVGTKVFRKRGGKI